MRPGRARGLALAARLFGAAEALRATIGAPRPPIAQPAYDQPVAAIRKALGADASERIWAAGALLSRLAPHQHIRCYEIWPDPDFRRTHTADCRNTRHRPRRDRAGAPPGRSPSSG
jgi:hypothetical protein